MDGAYDRRGKDREHLGLDLGYESIRFLFVCDEVDGSIGSGGDITGGSSDGQYFDIASSWYGGRWGLMGLGLNSLPWLQVVGRGGCV